LRRLAANAADHVGMSEGLGGSLLRLDVEGRRDGLGDAGVQRRGAAGDEEIIGAALVAGAGSSVTAIAGARAGEGRMGVERGSHGEGVGWHQGVVEAGRRSWGRSSSTWDLITVKRVIGGVKKVDGPFDVGKDVVVVKERRRRVMGSGRSSSN
jgi:hypothetical protein